MSPREPDEPIAPGTMGSRQRRPSSFYDRVAVGRIMTRITNDVQALFELMMGLGMLIGEFVPFALALVIMQWSAIQVRLPELQAFISVRNLAWVAAGRMDAYFEIGLKPWDVAAGALLVREAGGVVSDFDGNDAVEESHSILAAPYKLMTPLQQVISKNWK